MHRLIDPMAIHRGKLFERASRREREASHFIKTEIQDLFRSQALELSLFTDQDHPAPAQ